MGVELSAQPSRCEIGVAGGTKKYKLVNHCDRMLAYRAGKPRPDKMTIQYASVGQDARDPKKPFATGKPVGEITGETVMKLIAAE